MTCHNPDNESVALAAQWLASQNPPPKPVIPALKNRFGLTAVEACEAAAMADRFRMYRGTHG